MAANSGPHTKLGSDDSNRDRGFYPPENITEDNCPDCLGLSIGQVCKIHPPRWFTQGPRKFLEVDTIKNRHKYHGPEPGSPGFDPQAYSEFLKDEEEQRPYAVMYNRDVPLRPHVVAELGASDRGKDAELIYEEAVIIRGVPNFTQRGGGFRRYHFGRGITESYVDNFPPERFCQSKIIFDKTRDPLRKLESDKVVGRGHFPGGGRRVVPIRNVK